jgi:hypothetical protein
MTYGILSFLLMCSLLSCGDNPIVGEHRPSEVVDPPPIAQEPVRPTKEEIKGVEPPIIHPIAYKTCECKSGDRAQCDQFNVAECRDEIDPCYCGQIPQLIVEPGSWKCFARAYPWVAGGLAFEGVANGYFNARISARQNCVAAGESGCLIIPGSCSRLDGVIEAK